MQANFSTCEEEYIFIHSKWTIGCPFWGGGKNVHTHTGTSSFFPHAIQFIKFRRNNVWKVKNKTIQILKYEKNLGDIISGLLVCLNAHIKIIRTWEKLWYSINKLHNYWEYN